MSATRFVIKMSSADPDGTEYTQVKDAFDALEGSRKPGRVWIKGRDAEGKVAYYGPVLRP